MKSLVFTAANEMAGAYHMTGRFGCAQKNFRQLRRGHHAVQVSCRTHFGSVLTPPPQMLIDASTLARLA
jgi:hypothetical protein